MKEVSTIGSDLAKTVFQIHGADRDRKAGFFQAAKTGAGAVLLSQSTALSRCDLAP